MLASRSSRYKEISFLPIRFVIAKCSHYNMEVNTMAKGGKTFPIGRNAKTGEFTSVKKAQDKPSTHTVERMPKPGYGDTGSDKKK